jgi:signal transduction histidine kinase
MKSGRATPWVVAAASLGVVVITVVLTRVHQTAEHDTVTHAAVESVAAVVSIIAAALIFAWFAERRLLHFLVLGGGVSLLAAANLFLTAIPAALSDEGVVAEWGAHAGRCVGAAAIAAAAFVPGRRVRRPVRAVAITVAASLAVLALVVAAVAVVSPSSAVDGDLAVPAAQLATGLLFAAAAAGIVHRSLRERRDFLGWIAVAAGLAAVERFDYALAPSVSPGLTRAGDALRLASFVVLGAAAGREIIHYCRRLMARAAESERRRIGRDVHDRIAQDLAYIVRDARSLQLPEPVVSAAVRALEEARRVIEAAQRDADEPLWESIARSTADVAARAGTQLELDVATDAVVAPDVAEALVRVAREAVINADRHAGATRIRISLANGDGIRLTIVDDGDGFAAEDVGDASFGLTCMRERMESVGGRLTVSSAPGHGTAVEAYVP